MIPTSNPTLILKQFDFESRNYAGMNIQEMLFPSFGNPLTDVDDFRSRISALGFKSTAFDKLPVDNYRTEWRRRFDGGETLSRQCYYSISLDKHGNDGGTLVNELYSYSNFNVSGVVRLFDFAFKASEQSFLSLGINYSASDSGIYIVAIDNNRNESPFIREWLKHGLFTLRSKYYPNLRFAVAHYPYRLIEEKCEKVLDLRNRDAQDWLVELVKSWNNPSYKFKNEKAFDWFVILSLIIDHTHGGNTLTSRIGAYLRKNGVSGLIFPSARSNCGVEYKNGEITSFNGWNYVKFDRSVTNFNPPKEGGVIIPRFDPNDLDLTESIDNGWYINFIESSFYNDLWEKHRNIFEE